MLSESVLYTKLPPLVKARMPSRDWELSRTLARCVQCGYSLHGFGDGASNTLRCPKCDIEQQVPEGLQQIPHGRRLMWWVMGSAVVSILFGLLLPWLLRVTVTAGWPSSIPALLYVFGVLPVTWICVARRAQHSGVGLLAVGVSASAGTAGWLIVSGPDAVGCGCLAIAWLLGAIAASALALGSAVWRHAGPGRRS